VKPVAAGAPAVKPVAAGAPAVKPVGTGASSSVEIINNKKIVFDCPSSGPVCADRDTFNKQIKLCLPHGVKYLKAKKDFFDGLDQLKSRISKKLSEAKARHGDRNTIRQSAANLYNDYIEEINWHNPEKNQTALAKTKAYQKQLDLISHTEKLFEKKDTLIRLKKHLEQEKNLNSGYYFTSEFLTVDLDLKLNTPRLWKEIQKDFKNNVGFDPLISKFDIILSQRSSGNVFCTPNVQKKLWDKYSVKK
jgi:hypothetical protein